MQGIVKFYKEDKGFGFITDESGKDVFVHATGLTEEIRKGDEVSFDLKDGKKGKEACNVKVS
jgi:CspA family cold shock protein